MTGSVLGAPPLALPVTSSEVSSTSVPAQGPAELVGLNIG